VDDSELAKAVINRVFEITAKPENLRTAATHFTDLKKKLEVVEHAKLKKAEWGIGWKIITAGILHGGQKYQQNGIKNVFSGLYLQLYANAEVAKRSISKVDRQGQSELTACVTDISTKIPSTKLELYTKLSDACRSTGQSKNIRNLLKKEEIDPDLPSF